jgi:hypothetical protein
MKSKVLTTVRAVVSLFVVASVVAAAAASTASKVMPNPALLDVFGSPAPARASGYAIEATAPISPLAPTGTGFTYRGRLLSTGSSADGSYDFVFTLFDGLSGGSQVGDPQSVFSQTVSGGLFAVILDFGPDAFQGDARYLQIEVKPTGSPGYTLLWPRQPITSVPYAQFALKTAPHKNVVTVARSGGQFTSIEDALDSIIDAGSTNRYLVWVAPGVYGERVTMKEWVDIEGAGENATRITHPGSPNPDTGTVVGANNAELRSLTVENTGGTIAADYAIAIYNSGVSPSLLHVTAKASGGSHSSYAVMNDTYSSPNMTNVTAIASGASPDTNSGVLNNNYSSPNMTNVTAIASGGTYNQAVANAFSSSPNMTSVTATASGGTYSYGVVNNSASPKMTRVKASASGAATTNIGVYNTSSSPQIMASNVGAAGGILSAGVYSTAGSNVKIGNSKIAGSTHTVVNQSGDTTSIGASQLAGGYVDNAGTLACAGVYDENYTFYSNTCT